MTFFYDLNKKLADLNKPAEQLNERSEKWIQKAVDPSHKGDLHKALHVPQGEKIPKGKIEKATHSKNAHLRHMAQFAQNVAKEDVEEGFVDTVKQGAQAALGAIGQTLGHGSDEDMIKDLQKKAGVPVTGKVQPQQPGQQPPKPMAEDDMEEGNAFSKAVVDAKKDGIQPGEKITVGGKTYPVKEVKKSFADKIAGAKQEVDEMLGDVAAEAMKSALKGGQKKLDKNHNGRLDAQDFAMLRAGADKEETDESALQAYLGKKKYGADGMKALQKAGREGASKEKMAKIRAQHEVDEGWDDMMKAVKARASKPRVGDVEHGAKHDIEHTATGRRVTRRVDDKGMSVGAEDDKPAAGEKRGRGRPKKADKAPERVTSKAYKHKSGRKMSKEEIEEAIASLEECGYTVSPLDEKAVSKAQQRFMGMAHAMQKGEKIPGASKELKKVAKTMKKGDVEDFAKTKHKGLPEKKKKEETDESTVAGSVATAPAAGKAKGVVGKGIYDSLNRELEAMIAESMNVSVNMSVDEHGEPHKNITVSAEGDEAEHLAQLLNLAGVSAKAHDEHGEICPACGEADCGCGDTMVDENAPDWPTEPETTGEDDPNLDRWAGGLNKPKETGQTTIPVVNRDPRRGSFGPVEHAVDVREDKDLGMSLYAELQSFKAK